MTGPLALGGGRFAVPGNRWDLLAGEEREPVEVSVVVPYYQEQAALDLVLAGLAVQTHPAARLQVVIADDGSARPPVIPDCARALEPVVLRQEDHGFRAAAARNLGLSRCDGEVIVFLDGDTVPGPDYIRHISRLPALLPDAMVGGRRRHVDLAGWTPEALQEWFAGSRAAPREWPEPEWLLQEYGRTGDLLQLNPRSFTFLIGAVLAGHRDLVEAIGGFDGTFVGYGGEDYDFTYRAWAAGGVLAHVPDAVAWHHGPEWAVREQDPAHKREQKNREAMLLARRIPEPGTRGTGQIYAVPDVVVRIAMAGWALGDAVLTVRGLLAGLDAGVWLTGPDAAAVADVFTEDPRVHLEQVPGPVAFRARADVEVFGPLLAGPDLPTVVRGLVDADAGRLTLTGPDGVWVVVTTSRALHRAGRHADALGLSVDAAVELLFGATDRAATETELQPTRPGASLPAVFGGWG
ncbi:glycosyltransferase [Nakamurella flavida]|uniref:Glycosyltransferase n=1 Tax=Nakamurella flavida TaxID=363630 RepID=A0A938YLG2_9ACTN|nr:glycosyltransferase [Nakamurella flavida]MBM9478177.1 glycosyltransferase [Nakamurella flavida]MDP9778601.1 GT2 family glycosyltransferase [Nakamurella flavida]